MVAASSRSELVTLPLGFAEETKLRCTAVGNGSRQTNCAVDDAWEGGNMTPPIPCPLALVVPYKHGS
jgi:hypothetical protein